MEKLIEDEGITISVSKQRQYAFTLRRTNLKNGVCEDDYFKHINKFEIKGCRLVDYSFEQTAGLHMHGILEIPLSFNNIGLRVRGWNIKVEELYDEGGWRLYYLKDQLKEIEKEQTVSEDDTLISKLQSSLFKKRSSVGTTG